MTRDEWYRAFRELDPQFLGWDGGGSGKASPGAVLTRMAAKDRMKMGLPDFWDADERCFQSVRHQQVIEHALSLGLPVPPAVMAEYAAVQVLA